MSSKFSKLLSSWLHRSRAEEGQAMVMVALSLVVMLGFGAFAVDLGHVAVVKSDLQNAADAAALAGAAELSSSSATKVPAENMAIAYAKNNGMGVQTNGVALNGEKVIATATVSSKQVRVECSRKVDYYFAGVLGFKSKTVTAVAVAEENDGWAGESLPYINLGFDYTSTAPGAWTKVGPGIKGTIYDFKTMGTGDNLYFEVDYENGIEIKEGYANGVKGLDDSKLADGMKEVLKVEDANVKVVYLFSLRADIIRKGEFTVNNKTKKISLSALNKLQNGDVIDPDQLVLIQCRFNTCDWSNQHNIQLTYLGNVYDLKNTSVDVQTGKKIPDLPDLPTDYISSSDGTGAKLIQ